MVKVVLVVLSALTLSGCGFEASHEAKVNYIKATAAFNQCLLLPQNLSMPSNCTAQQTVMQNDFALYSNVSE